VSERLTPDTLRAWAALEDRLQRRRLVEAYHPADVAEALGALDDAVAARVLAALPGEGASVLEYLPPERQERLLALLGPEQAADVLEEMSSDEAADLLADLPAEEARRLLATMGREEAADVRELLAYPPDTAGGLMATEVVAIHETLSVDEALADLRAQAPDAETIYYVYVVETARRLVGVVSLRELILADGGVPISQIMRADVVSAQVNDDREIVARLFERHRLLALPVVDPGNRLVGVVTVDDVLEAVTEEASEDVYRLAGLVEEVESLDSPLQRAAKRLPWLLALLVVEAGAARVIQGFETVLTAVVAVAFFIPMLNDQAGNMGVQSAAIAVRAIATGEVDRRSYRRFVLRESIVGLAAGLASGAAAWLIGFVWQRDLMLGVTLGLTLAVVMLVASVAGSLIPLLMTALRRDPAVAAGPFITSSMDLVTVLVYLGIASILLGRLIGR
jgi:magnesium transporter